MKPYDKVRLKNYTVYSTNHDDPFAVSVSFPAGTEGTVITISAKADFVSGFAATIIIKGKGTTIPVCLSLLEVL